MPDMREMRNHLFDVLKGLKNGSIKVETAKTINETAQVLINSAKVEVDFLKVTNGNVGSGFIPVPDLAPKAGRLPLPDGYTAHGVKQVECVPGATITTHKMR